VFVLLIGFALPSESFAINSEIVIVIRVDDISTQSGYTPSLDFLEFCRVNNLHVFFGIPPNRSNDIHSLKNGVFHNISKDFEKVSFLKDYVDKGILEIGQHGWDHQMFKARMFGMSEFKGRSYDVQYKRIREGKTLLESLFDAQVITFMPPWNNYDCNTVKACRDLGFKIFASHTSGEYCENIVFIPTTCLSVEELESAIKKIYEIEEKYEVKKGEQYIIVLQLHPWDINENFSFFKGEILKILSRHKVAVLNFKDIYKLYGNELSTRRYKEMVRLSEMVEFLGIFKKFFLVDIAKDILKVYWPLDLLMTMNSSIMKWYYGVTAIVVMLTGFISFLFVVFVRQKLRKIFFVISLILFILILAYGMVTQQGYMNIHLYLVLVVMSVFFAVNIVKEILFRERR